MDNTNTLKKANPDLKSAEIEGLLYLLRGDLTISANELVRLSGLPKETVVSFLSSVAGALGTYNNPKSYNWSLFSYEDNEEKDLELKFSELVQKHRTNPKRELDQFLATSHTSVSKALVLKNKGLLEDKNILLLGDDDLVSISLGLLGGFKSITVFDADSDLLASIESIAGSVGIENIRTKRADFKDRIKEQDTGKFDVVITDPPYTKSGVALFLNRAVQLLGETKDFEGKYIFLYYGNSFKSPEKTLKIQEIISRFNLVVEDKIDKFARYYGAESIGSASSLYILKTTKFTKPLDEANLSDSIYTFENQKEEKFPYVSHLVIKVFGVPQNLISSKAGMLKALGKFCELHKLKVVDTKVTGFKGKGFSFTFILANSNLLAHSWPEFSALHLDLVTCSPIYNREYLGKNIRDLFKANGVEVRIVE